jgi:RNA polymerase sigma-70 factor, ECF subfamily
VDASFEGGATESALVARARSDPAAFDALALRHLERVRRFCYYRLGSWEDADDATQEVFIRAFNRFDRFTDRGPGSFAAWLLQIAFNETVDVHRRRERRPDVPFPEAAPWIDPAPSPEDLAVSASVHGYVRSLFAALPPDQRAVMELDAADLKTKEIATILGKREDHIRKLRERAYDRLRVRMLAASGIAGGGGHDG